MKNKTIKILVGLILIFSIIIFINIFSKEKNKENDDILKNNTELGSNLENCLEIANNWFDDSKKTAYDVLQEEKIKSDYSEEFFNSELEYINASILEEWNHYKKECYETYK